MKKQIRSVEKFHNAFGIKVNHSPILISLEESLLRYELMREENEEYLEAAQNNDLEEVADALGDKLYILCGTLLSHGMQHIIEEVFDRIQDSNMSKLDDKGKAIINGENGVWDESRPNGKVLKSANFFPPNFKDLL